MTILKAILMSIKLRIWLKGLYVYQSGLQGYIVTKGLTNRGEVGKSAIIFLGTVDGKVNTCYKPGDRLRLTDKLENESIRRCKLL